MHLSHVIKPSKYGGCLPGSHNGVDLVLARPQFGFF